MEQGGYYRETAPHELIDIAMLWPIWMNPRESRAVFARYFAYANAQTVLYQQSLLRALGLEGE